MPRPPRQPSAVRAVHLGLHWPFVGGRQPDLPRAGVRLATVLPSALKFGCLYDDGGLDVNRRRSSTMFDRFAESAANFTGHALFFGACVLLIAVWIPSYVFIRDLNTWQLIINT